MPNAVLRHGAFPFVDPAEKGRRGEPQNFPQLFAHGGFDLLVRPAEDLFVARSA